jgi:ABC-2 type transport system permease protein
MNAYLALFSARLRALLQYRAAAWAGVGTQLFFGLALIAMRRAFYEVNSAPQLAMTLSQTFTYTWLGQAFFALTPFTANPDPEVKAMMRDGSVAYELARPLDLYTLWFVRCAANRLAPTLLRCSPILVLGLLFFGLQPPQSIAATVAFLIAITGSLFLIAAWMTLISISLLWTLAGDGLSRIAPSIVLVFSGQLVPIAYYPERVQKFITLLPFRGMVDGPYQLWTGVLSPSGIGEILLHQLVWTLIFIFFGRWLLKRGLKRLVIQGG